MNIKRFLLWFTYSDDKPENIGKGRWLAMQKWYETRERLREPFVLCVEKGE